MSSLVTLAKYLNRRFKKHRAVKAGLPYDDEADRCPLYEDKLPDGTRIPSPTPEEINFLQRNGLGNGIDWKNWRKYFTTKYYTLSKISECRVTRLDSVIKGVLTFIIVSLFVIAVSITLSVLVAVYQTNILLWLAPYGAKWRA